MLQDVKFLKPFTPTLSVPSLFQVRNSFIMTTFVTDETSYEALDGCLNEAWQSEEYEMTLDKKISL
jgi:hypothetical protein